jgi:hypothetical protein
MYAIVLISIYNRGFLTNLELVVLLVSPTYQRFLKPLKSFDIVKNGDDITSFPI